jgi:protein-tyrosine phosphatase
VIDLHSHVLPGVDDGARTQDDAVALARAAAEDGVAVLAATPHVRRDYPTSAETMERLVEELRAVLVADGIELELRTGGELALEFLDELPAEELPRFGLGGSRALLVEFPYSGWPLGLGEQLFRLRARGFTPVLAHPERNDRVQADPARLAPLVDAGALVQLTAASVDGRLGRTPAAASRRLLELGLAHLLASDAHGPEIRGAGLSAAAVSLGPVGAWLTEEAPAAVLAGAPLPPRPEPRSRRRWWRR